MDIYQLTPELVAQKKEILLQKQKEEEEKKKAIKQQAEIDKLLPKTEEGKKLVDLF